MQVSQRWNNLVKLYLISTGIWISSLSWYQRFSWIKMPSSTPQTLRRWWRVMTSLITGSQREEVVDMASESPAHRTQVDSWVLHSAGLILKLLLCSPNLLWSNNFKALDPSFLSICNVGIEWRWYTTLGMSQMLATDLLYLGKKMCTKLVN